MSLEEEVDVGSELDALPAGHGQQPVVIQHRVQALDPFWVYIPIAHNPRVHLWEKKPKNVICKVLTQRQDENQKLKSDPDSGVCRTSYPVAL